MLVCQGHLSQRTERLSRTYMAMAKPARPCLRRPTGTLGPPLLLSTKSAGAGALCAGPSRTCVAQTSPSNSGSTAATPPFTTTCDPFPNRTPGTSSSCSNTAGFTPGFRATEKTAMTSCSAHKTSSTRGWRPSRRARRRFGPRSSRRGRTCMSASSTTRPRRDGRKR
ncbi:hypothetical protein AURDEDRAFT_145921 [Auricularia subglabra TFB-10046 SS5]|nr:hypothetical protein AURDEDRAFT_145921 [Auricularia subglabra TFB-10046 SS5]